MKILRIISRMNVGGPSKHVANLSEGLNKYNCETLLISGQPSLAEGDMFQLAHSKQISLKTIKYMKRPVSPLYDLISFIKIIIEIKRFSPDIVHTHTAKAGILGRAAALICGVPQIYHTYHGHVFKGYFSKFISRLILAIERFFSAFTTKLIVLTPNLATELKGLLRIKNSDKIEVIPLGLDLNKNLSTPRKLNTWRKSLGFSQNDFVIAIVARLVPVKNHNLLISSMEHLCKKFPELHLAIIGNGEKETELKQQVKALGLTNKIHFCGITNNMEIAYSDIDLLVLCSKNEGTPVVLIEALASGCPVAAIEVGGVKEVLKDGLYGRLLPSKPEEFTQALGKAINDIKEGKFQEYPTAETRQEVSKAYSVDNLVRNIYKLYSEQTAKQSLE